MFKIWSGLPTKKNKNQCGSYIERKGGARIGAGNHV